MRRWRRPIPIVKLETFESLIESAEVESMKVRCARSSRSRGRHSRPQERRWLPFTLRLYFMPAATMCEVMHTFVFDGIEVEGLHPGPGPAI